MFCGTGIVALFLACSYIFCQNQGFFPYKKSVNCALGKIIYTGYTTSTDCNTNYRIILLIMLFITLWYKPLKRDPTREIYYIWRYYICLLPPNLKMFNAKWGVIRK